MPTVLDVAAYILKKQSPMTAMKLQKLVYYAQAWSTVWDSKPLFSSRIEAWANGPVCPELYNAHRGEFVLVENQIAGDARKLNADERATVDAVLETYGDKSPQWLSDLTHSEDPWKNAREGLASGERGNRQITLASMDEYYGSLK